MRTNSKFVTFYSLCVATITMGWVGGGVQIESDSKSSQRLVAVAIKLIYASASVSRLCWLIVCHT